MEQNTPRDMITWIDGSWPGMYFGNLLTRSICLAVNKTPKTLEEIGTEIDANPAFAAEALRPLVEEDLVTKTARDRYLANFIAPNREDWIKMTQDIRRQAGRLADTVEQHLPKLEEAWNRTRLPERGFPWSTGIWPTLAIFVLNTGASRHIPQEPEPPLRASGHRYWQGGREKAGEEYELWCTGFSSTWSDEAGFHYGYFWSWALPRTGIGYKQERSMVMGAVADGVSDVDIIADRARLTVERTKEVIAEAIEMGLVRRTANDLSLTFPVLDDEEDSILFSTVNEAAAVLSKDFLEPATASCVDMFKELGYSYLQEQFPVWRRWLVGNVAGEALREMARHDILPSPGDPAPANFCLVGWRKQLKILSWKE